MKYSLGGGFRGGEVLKDDLEDLRQDVTLFKYGHFELNPTGTSSDDGIVILDLPSDQL